MIKHTSRIFKSCHFKTVNCYLQIRMKNTDFKNNNQLHERQQKLSQEKLKQKDLIQRNLNQGKLNQENLSQEKSLSHESITTFKSMRQEILSELTDPQCSGVLWTRYPELNRLLKGHRSGELTVFTGPTGCGKTTFVSEYSLDLCMQGVKTLWGSFEVKNVRLAKMMLTQYSERSLVKHLQDFDYWCDRFEQIPLYFMKFHGQQPVNNVLSVMSHAVHQHQVKHIIIDNIQFMLGFDSSNRNFKFDRFWQQDLIFDSFRKFATKEDCHVTLVIHPRKEVDINELNNNSIFGGAKASQEADNILILQNKWLPTYKCHKYIEITKNRWDGDLGKVPLWFDKESLSYSPKGRRTHAHQKESFLSKDEFSYIKSQNDGTSFIKSQKDDLSFIRSKKDVEEEEMITTHEIHDKLDSDEDVDDRIKKLDEIINLYKKEL